MERHQLLHVSLLKLQFTFKLRGISSREAGVARPASHTFSLIRGGSCSHGRPGSVISGCHLTAHPARSGLIGIVITSNDIIRKAPLCQHDRAIVLQTHVAIVATCACRPRCIPRGTAPPLPRAAAAPLLHSAAGSRRRPRRGSRCTAAAAAPAHCWTPSPGHLASATPCGSSMSAPLLHLRTAAAVSSVCRLHALRDGDRRAVHSNGSKAGGAGDLLYCPSKTKGELFTVVLHICHYKIATQMLVDLAEGTAHLCCWDASALPCCLCCRLRRGGPPCCADVSADAPAAAAMSCASCASAAQPA